MRNTLSRVASVALLAAVLAGCGSSVDSAGRSALAALALKNPQAPAQAPTPPVPSCGPVTASLRPPAAMPTPGAMPSGSFMARIEHRGYLIAGVDQNTLLFAYFNPLTGQPVGLEIDLLRQLAGAIFGNPYAIQFRAVTTAERIPAVRQGAVDVVADAMTITCARRRQVDFSTVYYDAGQRVLVPLNSPASSIRNMGGKRVCATVGSTSLDTLERQRPKPIPYEVAQRTDCLVALQEGLVDGVTSDDSILLGFRAQDPNTKIVGSSIAPEPYGMAISKDHPEFVRFVNGVLAQMRSDGTWRRIVSHWLGHLTTIPAPPRASYAG